MNHLYALKREGRSLAEMAAKIVELSEANAERLATLRNECWELAKVASAIIEADDDRRRLSDDSRAFLEAFRAHIEHAHNELESAVALALNHRDT